MRTIHGLHAGWRSTVGGESGSDRRQGSQMLQRSWGKRGGGWAHACTAAGVAGAAARAGMAGTGAGGSPRSHPACAGVAGLSSAPGWPGTRPRRRHPRQGEGCECRTRTGSRGFATLHCSTGETSATTRSDGPYHILAGSDGYWVSGRRGPIGRPRFDPRIVYRDMHCFLVEYFPLLRPCNFILKKSTQHSIFDLIFRKYEQTQHQNMSYDPFINGTNWML